MVAAGMGVGFVDITKLDYDPATVMLKRVRDFTLPVVLELVWSPHNPAPLLRPFVEEALRAIEESDAHPEGREISAG
jgi:DNA-binding transcriptional LysR family regulator